MLSAGVLVAAVTRLTTDGPVDVTTSNEKNAPRDTPTGMDVQSLSGTVVPSAEETTSAAPNATTKGAVDLTGFRGNVVKVVKMPHQTGAQIRQ